MKIVGIVIQLFATLPIWFFLLYKMLESIQASELMWFLFWIYVPSVFVGSLIAKLVEDYEKD